MEISIRDIYKSKYTRCIYVDIDIDTNMDMGKIWIGTQI